MNPVRKDRPFFYLTLKDVLTIICAAAIPIALAIYTTINSRDAQKQAEEARKFDLNQSYNARQHLLYDQFLDNIYQLDKDGHLQNNKKPWAFANAYYRAAHRQWDPLRKSDVLQFLKEKELIGRGNCSDKCGQKPLEDIIRLVDLNFDYIQLVSQTGRYNSIKLDCVSFEDLSMNNALFSSVNLHGAYFSGGQLNDVKFEGSSLTCATFENVDMRGVDFGTSNMQDLQFRNVDLTGAKLNDDQLKQARFYNTTLPNGAISGNDLRSNLSKTTVAPVQNSTIDCFDTNQTSSTQATATGQVTKTSTTTTSTTSTSTTTSQATTTNTTTSQAKITSATTGQVTTAPLVQLSNESECASNGKLITFDDFTLLEGNVTDGYENLNWSNVGYVNKYRYNTTNGYATATMSGNYSAYNNGGNPIAIRARNGTFSLKSIVLAAAWNDNLSISSSINSTHGPITFNFTLNVLHPTFLNLTGFDLIKEIRFTASGGTKNPDVQVGATHFAFDNLCIVHT